MVTSSFWHALKNRPSLLWNKFRETWGSKSLLFKHQIVVTLTAYSPTVDMAPTNRDPFATPTDHPKSSLVPMTSETHFWFESMIEFEMWFMNHRMKTVRKHYEKLNFWCSFKICTHPKLVCTWLVLLHRREKWLLFRQRFAKCEGTEKWIKPTKFSLKVNGILSQ